MRQSWREKLTGQVHTHASETSVGWMRDTGFQAAVLETCIKTYVEVCAQCQLFLDSLDFSLKLGFTSLCFPSPPGLPHEQGVDRSPL